MRRWPSRQAFPAPTPIDRELLPTLKEARRLVIEEINAFGAQGGVLLFTNGVGGGNPTY
jgi:hypothetical protein